MGVRGGVRGGGGRGGEREVCVRGGREGRWKGGRRATERGKGPCTSANMLLVHSKRLSTQGSSLCTAGTPGGDDNSTHPLSLHDAGTCATRS